MIRKEPTDQGKPDTEGEDLAAQKDGQVTASISSTGAAVLEGAEQEDSATRAKLAAHLTSFAQMRQNFKDVDRILTELDKEDVVKDGFVQRRVSMDERIKWLKHQKNLGNKARRENKRITSRTPEEVALLADVHKKTTGNLHFKDSIESGGTFGFWSEDRPHELRLDPSNMKVYSFSTFKLRWPHRHAWSIESSFKKLPKVPHRVSRNKKDGGAALLDAESGQELVFVRDKDGYWHQGRELPTALEMMKKKKPMDWQKFVAEDEATKHEQERFILYPNQTDVLIQQLSQFKTASKVERENVRETLMGMRHDMATSMKLKPRKDKGRANLRILNRAGSLCSFEVEIDKVTVGMLKKAIHNETNIEPEKQKLLYGGVQLLDSDLLNKHIAAGERTIDLLPASKKKKIGTAKKPAEKKPASLLENKPAEKKPAAQKPTVKSTLKHASKPALKSLGKKLDSEIAKLKVAKPLAKTQHEKSVAAKAKHVNAAKAQHEKAFAAKPKPQKAATAKAQHEKATAKVTPSSLLQTGETKVPTLSARILEKRKKWKIPKHVAPKRRTLYVREEDGTIHVEKQEIATPNHPLEELALYGPHRGRDKWSEIDRGIPITVLLEAEKEIEEKEDSKLVK